MDTTQAANTEHTAVRSSKTGGAACSCGASWKREGAAYLAAHLEHFAAADKRADR